MPTKAKARSEVVMWRMEVLVDGKSWSGEQVNDVTEFVWRESLGEIPAGRLTMFVADERDREALRVEECIGKEIEVRISQADESVKAVFKGEVHGAQRGGGEGDPERWTLHFMHKLHRLTRCAGCRMWASGDYEDGAEKTVDIVKQVLSDAGLAADVPSGRMRRNAFLQYRETDYNFLLRLLEDEGLWIRHDAEDGKIVVADSPGPKITVERNDLMDWSVSSATTPNKVDLWAPSNCKAARVGELNASVQDADAMGKKAYGDLPVKDFDVGLATNENMKLVSESLMRSMAGEGLCVECSILDATVRAGETVEFKDEGVANASGVSEAVVTESEIVFSLHEGGVVTRLRGQSKGSAFVPPRTALRPRIEGVLPAIVTTSESKCDELARVRVKFPWAPEEESPWIRVAQSWAGKDRGAVHLPHLNDEVLVAFEHGDPSQPIVIGSLYNSQNTPPVSLPGMWTRTVLKTQTGHMLTFEDKRDSEYIELTSGKGRYLQLDDGNKLVDLVSEEGTALTFDDKGRKVSLVSAMGHEIVVESDKSITLKVGSNKIVIDQQGISIEGMKIDLKADMNLNAEGGLGAVVKGGAQASLESSGQTVVKGSIVMIN